MKNQKRVGVVDLGIGNLSSVANSLSRLGASPELITDPSKIMSYERLILPGVGSFPYACDALDRLGWRAPLTQALQDDTIYILGICLGFQIMCSSSDEGPGAGLGYFPVEVKKLVFSNRAISEVHTGWNEVSIVKNSLLTSSIPEVSDYYFNHEYAVIDPASDFTIGVSFFNKSFSAIFSKDRKFGVQFHPEKSGVLGSVIFKNFLELDDEI